MYNYFKYYFLIFLLLCIFSKNVNTQTLNFQNYSSEDGLPQNTVFSLAQDSTGFIWIGTEAGLARFDGQNFKYFSLSEGLIGNNIGALYADKNGSIWIGTQNGLSILYENEIRNFTSKNGLKDNYVNGITADKKGNIWIATKFGGASRFKASKITNFTSTNGFPSDKLSTVITDHYGNIWFASLDKGLIKYNGKSFINITEENGLKSNIVHTIFEDRELKLWVGTESGISIIDNDKIYDFNELEKFNNESVKLFLQDIYGGIWIGFFNKGVLRFDGQNIHKYDGLESNEIRSGLIDKRGDLWFGTFLGGLSRLPADWFEIYDIKAGLNSDAVYPIAEDNEGKIYFGHYAKGVSVFDNGNISTINSKFGLISNDLSSILVDSKGNIWYGTLEGISKFDGKKFKSYNKKNNLKYDFVLKIFEDRNGFIWIASDGGISKYDPNVDDITEVYSEEYGIKNSWINDIYEDNSGNIWFATHNSGVLKFNGSNFEVIDTSKGLPINNIFSVTQDRYGNYWFGTDGAGLSKFDGKNFTNLNKNNGLSSNVCYYVLENEQYLYVGTVNGLTLLDNEKFQKLNELNFKYISKVDGLPSKELNQGSYLADSKGYLWFGTQEGVIKFDPNKTPLYENPNIFLSKIKVSDGLKEKVLSKLNDGEFNYKNNNITFEFFSINYAKPEQTVYEFMLEGIEEKWTETKQQTVSYRSLPPGSYAFKIRAKNSDAITGEEKILSTFIIHPPFYKTWWFISLSAISFFLIIFNVFYFKTQQVKKRNAILRAMVQERTKELEIEKNKSDELLHNILPATLVTELKSNGFVKPRQFKNISILFTDFKAFTYTTSVLPAEELVAELNDIFKNFDNQLDKYGIEKLKTIGDSYMAACGIPNEVDDHAIKIVYAALDFQRIIKERNKVAPIKWEMRLGIHSGSVVAGVVGTKKFTYDIWGDTVNIASRMESSGEPGEINISGYTYMLIRDYFECEYRGKVNAKGKGGIDMYYVRGVNRNTIKRQYPTYKPEIQLKQTT